MNQYSRRFEALADPTRRRIVELLSRRPRRAGELHAAFRMSDPAISRHLRVLRTSGLIERLPADDGRVRLYALRFEPLRDVERWIQRMGRMWQLQLDSFQAHVEAAAVGTPRRGKRG